MLINGVGVVVERQGQILLGKRSSGDWKGYWSLPGGKIEQSESIEDCARRELKEETNLSAKGKIQIISVSTEIDTALNFHSITFGVTLREFRGALKNREPNKFSTWQWKSLTSLPQKLFQPTRSVLTAYYSSLNRKIPSFQGNFKSQLSHIFCLKELKDE